MNPENEPPRPAPTPELVFRRTLEAPRDLVWQAWTDPAHLAHWWGPSGYTIPRCELDLQPGGAVHIDMEDPEGHVISSSGTVHEVYAPKRLVFSLHSFEDEAGEPQLEVHYTTTLTAHTGHTTLTLHALVTRAGPGVAASLAQMEVGWNQSLDRLERRLLGTPSGAA